MSKTKVKVMQVVYSTEASQSTWSGGEFVEETYMGEDTWRVGDTFKGIFITGTITSICLNPDDTVSIYVKKVGSQNELLAMWLPAHAVQRIYYGEGTSMIRSWQPL